MVINDDDMMINFVDINSSIDNKKEDEIQNSEAFASILGEENDEDEACVVLLCLIFLFWYQYVSMLALDE